MPLIPLFIQNEVEGIDIERMSMFNFCDPFDHVLPFVDNEIDSVDRQHLWGLFSGIEAAPPSDAEELTDIAIYIYRHRRLPRSGRC